MLYGAAEFSRDLDLALLPDPANLDRLEAALAEMDAEVIAVLPLSLKHLDEGLAVHFRPAAPRLASGRPPSRYTAVYHQGATSFRLQAFRLLAPQPRKQVSSWRRLPSQRNAICEPSSSTPMSPETGPSG